MNVGTENYRMSSANKESTNHILNRFNLFRNRTDVVLVLTVTLHKSVVRWVSQNQINRFGEVLCHGFHVHFYKLVKVRIVDRTIRLHRFLQYFVCLLHRFIEFQNVFSCNIEAVDEHLFRFPPHIRFRCAGLSVI